MGCTAPERCPGMLRPEAQLPRAASNQFQCKARLLEGFLRTVSRTVALAKRALRRRANPRRNPQATRVILRSAACWSRTLGLCRRWLGCRRRCVRRSETHLGDLPRAFFGLEVGIVPSKSTHARHQTVREERNKRVVILHRLVVTAALHRDPIFCARQLVL